MKSFLQILLFLFTAEKCFSNASNWIINKASVSINGKQHDSKFNIKYMKQNPLCDEKEKVNLDKKNLVDIKSDIVRSDVIRHLSFGKNLLNNIPQNIDDHVPNLYCINFTRNKIDIYKQNSFEHHNLQVLDLTGQEISELDDLEINSKDVENIYKPWVFNSTGMFLPSLQHLILDDNYITEILLDFKSSFPHLTNLYLNNIGASSVEPQFFNKIPMSLRVLHLKNNHIRNFKFNNLAHISELRLDGNSLESIDIVSTKLQFLSLSNCKRLNTGIFNTPYLQYLDLSNNDITSVSNIKFNMFQSLHTLVLDHNKLTQIPTLPQTLFELSLSYNAITQISENSFINLMLLKKLSLKGNLIKHIDENNFLYLKNLELLDLSHNKMKTLPQNWMLPLIKLQYLNMNSNEFASVSDLAINQKSTLMHLFVVSNEFDKISIMELDVLPHSITVYLG